MKRKWVINFCQRWSCCGGDWGSMDYQSIILLQGIYIIYRPQIRLWTIFTQIHEIKLRDKPSKCVLGSHTWRKRIIFKFLLFVQTQNLIWYCCYSAKNIYFLYPINETRIPNEELSSGLMLYDITNCLFFNQHCQLTLAFLKVFDFSENKNYSF